MIRVFITDDHTMVRRGLRQLLEDYEDISVVGEAGSGVEMLTGLRNIECDVAVLDISLPDKTGIELLEELRVDHPALPVLILTMHPEEQYAVRAIRASAAGYLTKESAPDELVAAIRKVHAGGRYVSASLAEHLLDEISSQADGKPHDILSDREYQVLCLIGSGYSLSDIARNLCLSVKTISTYRTRILTKMAMKNNVELAAYVIRNGLASHL